MELNDFKIQEEELLIKHRFVYSDWNPISEAPNTPLKNALINVSLSIKSHNYQKGEELVLYILIADRDTVISLAEDLSFANVTNSTIIDNIMKDYVELSPIYTALILD